MFTLLCNHHFLKLYNRFWRFNLFLDQLVNCRKECGNFYPQGLKQIVILPQHNKKKYIFIQVSSLSLLDKIVCNVYTILRRVKFDVYNLILRGLNMTGIRLISHGRG